MKSLNSLEAFIFLSAAVAACSALAIPKKSVSLQNDSGLVRRAGCCGGCCGKGDCVECCVGPCVELCPGYVSTPSKATTLALEPPKVQKIMEGIGAMNTQEKTKTPSTSEPIKMENKNVEYLTPKSSLGAL